MVDYSPIKNRATKYAGLYLGIICVILAFGVGVFVGQKWYIQNQVTNENGQIDISKVVNFNRSLNKSNSVEFNQFWEVWDKVKSKYVKQPVNDVDLFYGAIQGMVYGLGDPYSMYFPPKAAQEFVKSLSGEFSGIGAEIGIKNNQLVVVAPLPETPAAKAGLKPGDKIMAIDKKPTFGMDVETAVQHIRGTPTSSVTLTISRNGWDKPKDFTIHRAQINVPAIMYEVKPGNIAYIRVMQFNDRTPVEFGKYVDRLKKDNVKGVVLDLRNNPGGYLESAIFMSSEWIKEGDVVVKEKFSGNQENTHTSTGLHRLLGMKTIVLVNGGSASASEIVAGALKDQKVATLIGEKTFGKGSVQDFETLSDGSALKVTVAEWYTPNNNNINETGIMPDVEVKENLEQGQVGEDPVLDKALQLIKK